MNSVPSTSSDPNLVKMNEPDDKLCDVIIRIQEKTFKCNRKELASVSEYFNKMFKERYDEEITLPDIDAEVFEQILKFEYTKSAFPNITEGNVYTLLKLGVSEEDCIEFIQENLSSIKNTFELFGLACSTNKSSLIKDLSHQIIQYFCVLSQSDKFLRMTFNEFNVILKEYRSAVSAFRFIRFRDENLLLDVLLKWLHHSPNERKHYLEELLEFIDFERISSEYLKFFSNEYTKCADRLSLKECIKDYLSSIATSMGDTEHSVLPISYGNLLASKNETKLHVIVHYWEKWNDSRIKTFSINKHQPEWSVSCVNKRLAYFDIRNVVLDDPNNYLYCFIYNSDTFKKPSFRAYSSININSKSCVKVLTSPPCNSGKFDVCGMRSDSIYWYNSNIDNANSYKAVSNSGDITEEEIRRGIYRYNCDLDKWFSVPKMKTKVSDSCLITDTDLVYLIGGKGIVNGYVQAYDHRAPTWLQLPATNSVHRNATGCNLNGKIYVSDLKVVETYDSVAGKWRLISKLNVGSRSAGNTYANVNKKRKRTLVCREKKMVSFENLLWIFGCNDPDFCHANVIDPYEPMSKNWCKSRSLKKFIRMEDDTYKEEYGTDNDDRTSTDSFRSENWSYRAICSIKDAVIFKSL